MVFNAAYRHCHDVHVPANACHVAPQFGLAFFGYQLFSGSGAEDDVDVAFCVVM
jgi:hypothetical protein